MEGKLNRVKDQVSLGKCCLKRNINEMMIWIKQIPRRAFQVEESLHIRALRHKQTHLIRLRVKEPLWLQQRERKREKIREVVKGQIVQGLRDHSKDFGLCCKSYETLSRGVVHLIRITHLCCVENRLRKHASTRTLTGKEKKMIET